MTSSCKCRNEGSLIHGCGCISCISAWLWQQKIKWIIYSSLLSEKQSQNAPLVLHGVWQMLGRFSGAGFAAVVLLWSIVWCTPSICLALQTPLQTLNSLQALGLTQMPFIHTDSYFQRGTQQAVASKPTSASKTIPDQGSDGFET